MQKLNTTYSQFYNKKNKRVGYVFRDRYNSQDILNIKHLYNCLKYIHNNPVKAGISINMEGYEYSSYKEFIGKRYIINNKCIKLLFGTLNNYKEIFKSIHAVINDNDNEFIDVKEKNINEFILDIEQKYNQNIRELIKNKKTLKEIIKSTKNYILHSCKHFLKVLNFSKCSLYLFFSRQGFSV